MIYAIGHDIVDVTRIQLLLNRYPKRLVNKLLSKSEQQILLTNSNPAKFIAKRFAAKEAFAKACGTGLRLPIIMVHISVVTDKSGKPSFSFTKDIRLWLHDRDIKHCHLSISDEINLASAVVVLET
jgi:holo-[acyl-carrier protein] synthase